MNKKVKPASKQEAGIGARIVIVIVLSLTFIGVLRWSMNVTSANAKQISHNLSQIQQRMNSQAASEQDKDAPGARIHSGPSIDPVGNGKR